MCVACRLHVKVQVAFFVEEQEAGSVCAVTADLF